MNVKIVSGNLLDATEEYIMHQCNCISNGASGIARAIFDRFPYADVYASRKVADVPGTIEVCGNGKDQRFVINAFAQFYPGGPSPEAHDTKLARKEYFWNCLLRATQYCSGSSIALPMGIGCGLAQGSWDVYSALIEEFANQLPDTKVVLYKL